MAAVNQFTVKDGIDIRDDILRTLRVGLIARGVANPNVTPGSDWYVLATAVGNELAVVGANAIIKADEQMPDTAGPDGILRIAGFINRTPQGASGSIGGVVLKTSAATTVTAGVNTLIDGAGLRFDVVTSGVYVDGQTVPIVALDTGAATNHEEGDVLRWTTSPTFADERALVAPGGLINGVDVEDTETVRANVFATLQNAPGSGNWEQVAEIAEASTPSVQKGFVEPAIGGPATVGVTVTAAPTKTSKSRVLAPLLVTGTVKPYVEGQLAERTYVILTSVEDVNADVAFAITIPDAPTASPPGLGGGWKNATPWPRPNGSTSFRCTVTGVTSTTVFTVDAADPPAPGLTRIAWLSPLDWRLYQAVVVSYTGTSGAYVLTIDRPFVGIMVGAYIWPDCERAQAYVDAVLASFAQMGPGERDDNASALARGFRHPAPNVGWPNALGQHLLRALTDAGDEVADASFLHRTDGTTTVTGSGGQVSPQVPATREDEPLIFVPRHIAFLRTP